MDIIDTPAEGFPLPQVDSTDRRTVRDVFARLTPGGRANAQERARVTAEFTPVVRAHLEEHAASVRDQQLEQARAAATLTDGVTPPRVDPEVTWGRLVGMTPMGTEEEWASVDERNPPPTLADLLVADLLVADLPSGVIGSAWGHPVTAEELRDLVSSGAVAEVRRGEQRIRASVESITRRYEADVEAQVAAAFAGGRAYERGATIRRGVGAKSLGSRRVQAMGVATDYLADDPQDGARLAALVLAGFHGQDPASVVTP